MKSNVWLSKLVVCCFFQTLSVSAFAKNISVLSIESAKTPGAATMKSAGKNFKKISSVEERKFGKGVAYSETRSAQPDTFLLDLDETVVSFSIVIYTEKRNFGYIYKLTDPHGKEIISPKPTGVSDSQLQQANGRGQMLSANAMLPEAFMHLSVTPVPISDQVRIIPGRWTFSIAAEELKEDQDDTFEVSVFVKKTTEKINKNTQGLVHIQSYSTKKSGVPLSAKEMQKFVDESSALKSIGLRVQQHEHKVLDETFDLMCDSAGRPCYEPLTKLREGSSDRVSGLLKVFFMQRNNDSNSGIANLAGSVSSLFKDWKKMFDGVFVWTDPALMGSIHNSRVTFVHELGHQLGLYHANEDVVSDTNDFAKNIMTAGHFGATGEFTEGQKYVLLRSVIVELYNPESNKK